MFLSSSYLWGVLGLRAVAWLEGIAADTDANPELWQISAARRNGVGAPSVGADAPELLRRPAAPAR